MWFAMFESMFSQGVGMGYCVARTKTELIDLLWDYLKTDVIYYNNSWREFSRYNFFIYQVCKFELNKPLIGDDIPQKFKAAEEDCLINWIFRNKLWKIPDNGEDFDPVEQNNYKVMDIIDVEDCKSLLSDMCGYKNEDDKIDDNDIPNGTKIAIEYVDPEDEDELCVRLASEEKIVGDPRILLVGEARFYS